MVEDAIYNLLSSDTDITAYTSTRIYPYPEVPHNPTYPFIAFMRVGSDPIEHLRGSSGLCYARIQVDVFHFLRTGLYYRIAKLIAEEVRKCLHGYRGTAASIEIGGISMIGDSNDGVLDPPHGEVQGIARVTCEFRVGFYQTIPSQ